MEVMITSCVFVTCSTGLDYLLGGYDSEMDFTIPTLLLNECNNIMGVYYAKLILDLIIVYYSFTSLQETHCQQ